MLRRHALLSWLLLTQCAAAQSGRWGVLLIHEGKADSARLAEATALAESLQTQVQAKLRSLYPPCALIVSDKQTRALAAARSGAELLQHPQEMTAIYQMSYLPAEQANQLVSTAEWKNGSYVLRLSLQKYLMGTPVLDAERTTVAGDAKRIAADIGALVQSFVDQLAKLTPVAGCGQRRR